MNSLTLNYFRNQPAAPSGPKFPIKKEDAPKIKAMIESIEVDPNAEPFL